MKIIADLNKEYIEHHIDEFVIEGAKKSAVAVGVQLSVFNSGGAKKIVTVAPYVKIKYSSFYLR